MRIEDVLEVIVPDPEKSREAAWKLHKDHPELSPQDLAMKAVRSSKRQAAAAGAVTGIAANPITMLPAALADMAAVLKIEGSMVGVVAALLDPAALNDPKTLKADVISIVFPGAVSQALRQLGIRAGERVSHSLIRKYVSEEFVKSLARLVPKYIGMELTRETVLKKTVPLVGIGIGAGWNWLEVQAVGARAVHYYTDGTLGPARRIPLPPWLARAWRFGRPA